MTYVENAPPSERTTSPVRSTSPAPGPVAQVLVGVLAMAMPIITAVDQHFSARPVLALLYLLAVPGVPVAALIRLPSRLATATLAIALSLAVQVLVAQGSLMAHVLDAIGAEIAVSALSLVALAFGVTRLGLFARSATRPLAGSRFRQAGSGLLDGWFVALGLGVALALWVFGVHSIDPTRMTAYGLVSVVLRSTIPLALAVVAALAVVELRRPRLRPGRLAAITAAFVLVLQGTPAAVEPAASLPSAWVHVGFSDYIRDHGAVLQGFDARFSWPGFFAMLANLARSAGLSDAGEFLRWAPLVQNLLMLLPVLLLARRLSAAPWVAWLSALLYTAGNWFQQDYLSPQGLALYLGVAVLALVVWSADELVVSPPGDGRGAGRLRSYLQRPRAEVASSLGLTRSAHLALGGSLVVLLLAVVVSHQLTPVALVIALAWISYVRWTRFPGLWIVLAVMTFTWVFYGATDFWSGHLNEMFGGVGSLGASLNSGVGARIVGNPEHTQMLYLRFAFSGAMIVLALIGLYLNRRSSRALVLLGLSFSPFLIIALQSYGGEVVIRAFVYALPALSITAAHGLVWMIRRGRPWIVAGWVVLVAVGLVLTATRGANAPFERITPTQLQATAAFNRIAAPGATVGSFSSFNPLGRLEPARYYGKLVNPTCSGSGPTVKCTISSDPDYLFITSSQEAYGELSESRAPGWTDTVVGQLVSTHQYTISYQVADAVILKRVGPKA